MTRKRTQDQIVKDMADKIADETALVNKRAVLADIARAVAEHKPEGDALELIKGIVHLVASAKC